MSLTGNDPPLLTKSEPSLCGLVAETEGVHAHELLEVIALQDDVFQKVVLLGKGSTFPLAHFW